MFDNDDLEIEDVLNNRAKKKRKNSKNKGKRGESPLVKIFNERFKTNRFSRVCGSGNRWAQVDYATKDYTGDLVTPDNFRFTIEVKFGYSHIDLTQAVCEGNATLDSFFKQAVESAKRIKAESLVFWKKDRKPWLVFIKENSLPTTFDKSIKYNEWIGISLSNFLSLPDDFFFGKE